MIRPTKRNYLNVLKNAALTVLDFALCTALCFLLDFLRLNDLNFLIIYILGILLLAVFTKGYTYSWVLSLICVLGYNFFFTEPRFSLKINDSNYLATFILMFAVGVAISLITFQLKKDVADQRAQSGKDETQDGKRKGTAQSHAVKEHFSRSAHAAHHHQERRGTAAGKASRSARKIRGRYSATFTENPTGPYGWWKTFCRFRE